MSARIEDAARRGSQITHTAYMRPVADIGTRHRLHVGDKVYSVIGPARDIGGQGDHIEVDLVEVVE